MVVEATAQVERLRPAALQSKPVRMDRVFDDPEAVVRLIRDRAPHRTMAAYHKLSGTMGWQGEYPWFRENLEDDLFLNNPVFLRRRGRLSAPTSFGR